MLVVLPHGSLCLISLRQCLPLNLEQAVLGLQTSTPVHGFSMWVLGSELRFPCLHSKSCTHRVIFLPCFLRFVADYKQQQSQHYHRIS